MKLNLDVDTETGPGVLETALAYTSALRMADNAVLFKYTAKSVGMKHGIVPSFMAKPWNGVSLSYPFRESVLLNDTHYGSFLGAAGESICFSKSFLLLTHPIFSHTHVSLRNKEGRNIFAVSDGELKSGRANAANADTKFISQEAEWFLAGVLDGIADGICHDFFFPQNPLTVDIVMPTVIYVSIEVHPYSNLIPY